jgi:hypothetical protein
MALLLHTMGLSPWLVVLASLQLGLLPWAATAAQRVPRGNATEAAALLEFKAGLANSKALGSWNVSTNMCARWKGVRCTRGGQVAQVDLSRMSLAGRVVWDPLVRLSVMSELFLESNSLSGSLPAVLPPSLLVLRLGANNISGTFPPTLDLGVLKEVHIEYNQLSGALPALNSGVLEMLNLVCVRLPHCDRSSIRSEPDSCLHMYQDGTPRCLLHLYAANCLATRLFMPSSCLAAACKPSSWRTFSMTVPPHTPASVPHSHQSLQQHGRPMPGPFAAPPLPGWKSIEWAFPAQDTNMLTGFPTEFSEDSTLQELILSHNQLSGPLPTGLWLPSSLETLNLAFNQLSGPIPADLALPRSLTWLSLASNNFSGPLPSGLRLPGRLKMLFLDGNALTGPVAAWELPPSLLDLSLANNSLTSSIPASWLPLGLLTLSLDHNAITGQLPASWQVVDTARLDLTFNNITGTIPRNWTLACAENGCTVRLFGNQLSGE